MIKMLKLPQVSNLKREPKTHSSQSGHLSLKESDIFKIHTQLYLEHIIQLGPCYKFNIHSFFWKINVLPRVQKVMGFCSYISDAKHDAGTVVMHSFLGHVKLAIEFYELQACVPFFYKSVWWLSTFMDHKTLRYRFCKSRQTWLLLSLYQIQKCASKHKHMHSCLYSNGILIIL